MCKTAREMSRKFFALTRRSPPSEQPRRELAERTRRRRFPDSPRGNRHRGVDGVGARIFTYKACGLVLSYYLATIPSLDSSISLFPHCSYRRRRSRTRTVGSPMSRSRARRARFSSSRFYEVRGKKKEKEKKTSRQSSPLELDPRFSAAEDLLPPEKRRS